MLQESTTTLLVKLVQSLESAGEAAWDEQVELGKDCLYEMHQMTRPSFRAYRTTTAEARWPTNTPNSAKLNRAMPHVKAMVKAIRHKDCANAALSGKAAIAEMNGAASKPPLPVAQPIAQPIPKSIPHSIPHSIDVKPDLPVKRRKALTRTASAVGK